jgi:hypothetical protein
MWKARDTVDMQAGPLLEAGQRRLAGKVGTTAEIRDADRRPAGGDGPVA